MANEAKRNKQYNDYVEKVTPKNNCPLNCVKAFITGGAICTVGQIISAILKNTGMEKDEVALWVTVSLVFASIVLTGFNISAYHNMGRSWKFSANYRICKQCCRTCN